MLPLCYAAPKGFVKLFVVLDLVRHVTNYLDVRDSIDGVAAPVVTGLRSKVETAVRLHDEIDRIR